ncbi:MAG: prepilin-type N-terminal cleavage/methylation domain-containing protein [Kiritimatiellaeota bacterium]|nr:prepilin-type N-terminal cleavage/methylation domain-containing protein [Kiritimatiellota bacterium]
MMSRIAKRKGSRRGFTLLELTISLVVGALFMIGMLPLVRMAATRGTDMQLQVRDVIELQSLVERLSAWNAQNDVVAMKAALGGPGAKTGIGQLGDFYLHSADYIYFDGSDTAQTTNGVTALLNVRVGLSPTGPSLSKVFGNL